MSFDGELLKKTYLQFNFLLLLLLDQEFLADGFHSKLLTTDSVGEEIDPGERSFTKQFSSLIDDLLTGIGGPVNQIFWRLEFTGS